MRTVEQDADVIGESTFDALPERVQEALGELAGAAKEGLLALSVGVGLGVLHQFRPTISRAVARLLDATAAQQPLRMLGPVTMPPAVATDRELRAAQLAHVLARAARNDEVAATDVLRLLRHELRRLNTGNKLKIPTRSADAQAVIDKCAAAGETVPNNNSDDALHADHVWPITERHLKEVTAIDAWIVELKILATVVCVTARENYRLIRVEKTTPGPEKYAIAGVAFTTADVPWAGQV